MKKSLLLLMLLLPLLSFAQNDFKLAEQNPKGKIRFNLSMKLHVSLLVVVIHSILLQNFINMVLWMSSHLSLKKVRLI